MLRVLLVFDEYQELMTTETYLKKLGFDVVGIMNEMSIQEQVLSFNPEIMIVSGRGNKVSSFSVGKKLKDGLRFDGKVVLAVPKGVRPTTEDLMRMKMDVLMEAPINSDRLIQVLAKYMGASADVMLEKLRKARMSDPDLNQKMTMISGAVPATPAKSVRSQKYARVIAETPIDTKKTNFEKNQVKKRQDELKKAWDFNELEEIDKLKREFATALFKRK